jgi:hypothetical protein
MELTNGRFPSTRWTNDGYISSGLDREAQSLKDVDGRAGWVAEHNILELDDSSCGLNGVTLCTDC